MRPRRRKAGRCEACGTHDRLDDNGFCRFCAAEFDAVCAARINLARNHQLSGE